MNDTIVISEAVFRRELHAGGENLAALMRAVHTLDWGQRERSLVRRWQSLDPELQRAIETLVERLTTAPPFDVH